MEGNMIMENTNSSVNVIRRHDPVIVDGPLYSQLVISALAGAATTVATRHDCTPEKMAKAAVSIAIAVLKELKDE